MIQLRLVILYSILYSVSARFFDVCPERRRSIGACLAGLCPSGAECLTGHCCEITVTTTTSSAGDISVEESSEFGRCKNGRYSIGECISETCPLGHKCEDGLCCKPGLPPIRVTMIPVEIPTKTTTSGSTFGSTEYSSSTELPEVEEEEIELTKVESTTDGEMTEIESIKNSFKKGSGERVRNIKPAPSTGDEDYDIDFNIVEDREEKYLTTTSVPITTTTTEPPTTITSTTTTTTTTRRPTTVPRRRLKTRRPFTTSPPPKPRTTTTERYSNSTVESVDLNLLETGCPVGAPIGECVSNQCPEGHACFHGNCCILTPQINCTDVLPDCKAHLCNQRGYNEFMTKKCPRTCAKCHMAELDKKEVESCRDRRKDCDEWAAEGFCDSTLYTTRQKLKFCGKSCKLC